MEDETILLTQLHQLSRLLKVSKVSMYNAHYIIFSDYPSISHLSYVLNTMRENNLSLSDGNYVYNKLVKLRAKLVNQ